MKKTKKEYAGSAYIGVVGSDKEHGVCRDSQEAIARRPGDALPVYARGTKGFEGRQTHINKFIESHHDFILLLDHDMVFAADTLERLRSHKLPYVSGYYMRRTLPVTPVWFEPFRGFPYTPYTGVAERGKLQKIGASGWGCVLMHRDVVLAVRSLLKGEEEIIEDDMDIYPYDLERVISAIRGLRLLVEQSPDKRIIMPALESYAGVLAEEIRPLRVIKSNVGSDIRFPFYALKAGYQLWGDPDVRPGHLTEYPLSPNDYDGTPEKFRSDLRKLFREGAGEERKRIRAMAQELAI